MKSEFNKLDELMLKSVRNAMSNADVLLIIVDAMRDPMVGRCRLTASKPEMKARLVSALETKM
jgi:GTPase Era involved in 16S rRNA processing